MFDSPPAAGPPTRPAPWVTVGAAEVVVLHQAAAALLAVLLDGDLRDWRAAGWAAAAVRSLGTAAMLGAFWGAGSLAVWVSWLDDTRFRLAVRPLLARPPLLGAAAFTVLSAGATAGVLVVAGVATFLLG